MEALSIVLRVTLALTFLVAAVSKLSNVQKTKESVGSLGVSRTFVPIATWAVPILEIIVAVFLAIGNTTLFGAALVVMLLAAFTALGVVNLMRGRHPKCNCFGRISTERIGAQWLTRNLLLLAFGVVLLLAVRDRSNASIWKPLEDLQARDVVLYGLLAGAYVLIILLAAAVYYLVRLWQEQIVSQRNADASPEQDGLPAGEIAPPFELPTIDDRLVAFNSNREASQSTLLLFMSTHCGPCKSLISNLK
jgi:hypothetical protein